MVRKCCVPGCENIYPKVKFHRFPRNDIEVLNEWVKRIKNDILKGLDPEEINKKCVVCHEHFSTFSLVPVEHGTRKGIKERSVPTINVPGFKGIPTAENSVLIAPHPSSIVMGRIILCSVPGCKDMSSTRYRFPFATKELDKYTAWIRAVGSQELARLDPMTVYNRHRICQRHFPKEILTWNGRLTRGAIPKLYLPISKGTVQHTIQYTHSA